MNEKNSNISCFMLGIQRIFIIIRSQIRNPYNINLLEEISKYCLVLKDGSTVECETFKTEIIKIVKDNTETKEFLENALKIDYISFITDNLSEINRYLPVLSDSALEICKQLRNKNYDRAYDLIDATHCLPESIISKKQWNPKAFWSIYIKPYREKWNNDFLGIVEKTLI